MRDIKKFVNERVNKNSTISEVVEEEKGFEKTATKKIRRFLYTQKDGKGTGENNTENIENAENTEAGDKA